MIKNFTNYKYVINGNTIYAITTYGGHSVRGKAICSDLDNFDEEYGKQLAAARCNLKVAEQRRKNAERKYNLINNIMKDLNKEFDDACEFYTDAHIAENEAYDKLFKLINK